MPVTVKKHVTRTQAKKIARTFGVTCTPRQVAALGVWGERSIYDALRDGTFPIEPIKVGNHWRLPTAAILKYLGLED